MQASWDGQEVSVCYDNGWTKTLSRSSKDLRHYKLLSRNCYTFCAWKRGGESSARYLESLGPYNRFISFSEVMGKFREFQQCYGDFTNKDSTVQLCFILPDVGMPVYLAITNYWQLVVAMIVALTLSGMAFTLHSLFDCCLGTWNCIKPVYKYAFPDPLVRHKIERWMPFSTAAWKEKRAPEVKSLYVRDCYPWYMHENLSPEEMSAFRAFLPKHFPKELGGLILDFAGPLRLTSLADRNGDSKIRGR